MSTLILGDMLLNTPPWPKLRPCHTKHRFHCVGTELFNYPARLEIAMIVFVKRGMSGRSNNDQGVVTQLAWCSIAEFLCSHDAFAALSRHSRCMHYAFMAFALR